MSLAVCRPSLRSLGRRLRRLLRSVTRIKPVVADASTPRPPSSASCAPLRERCSRLRRSPLLAPARLKSHATRPVTTHSPRVMPFAETARAPCARLRSKVAYGSKEAAAGIRLRRLDAARTDSGGYFAAETEGDVMRSFAEDGSHAPPGASHNMPFCSTGGTRQRPRCRSGGRRPAAKRGLSRKAPRRYRFQGGAFRLRPRPPLFVLVAAPLGFWPPAGGQPVGRAFARGPAGRTDSGAPRNVATSSGL